MNRSTPQTGRRSLPHRRWRRWRSGAVAQRNGAVSPSSSRRCRSRAEGKIEVLEFFWYGCIHCYNLEPKIETWLKTAPKDVEFRRVPAVFNRPLGATTRRSSTPSRRWALLDKLHRPFFDAIHRDRLRTDNVAGRSTPGWRSSGVDPKKFDEAAQSFGVQSKVKRAIRLTSDYKIDGTPAMAVHGRYTVPAERRDARHRQPAGRGGPQEQAIVSARLSSPAPPRVSERRWRGITPRQGAVLGLISRRNTVTAQRRVLRRRRHRRSRAGASGRRDFIRRASASPTW